MSATLVPTPETRKLAARMVTAASEQGFDVARMVRDLEKGQELALVALLAVIAAGNVADDQAGGPPRSRAERVADLPVHDLIACPRCRARIYERCRSKGGHDRSDHVERIIPRRCRCGNPLDGTKGRRWCPPCAEVAAREQNRVNSQAWRDRQKRQSEADAVRYRARKRDEVA